MVSNNQISKFGEALITLYSDNKELEKLLDELNILMKLWDKEEMISYFFYDPSVDQKHKKEVIKKLLQKFKFDEYFLNTLFLIIDFKHEISIGLFFESLKNQIFEKLKIKIVNVESSIELSEMLKRRLETDLKQKTKLNLIFNYKIDPDLVIGIRVIYDDYVEEYSLSTQIKRIMDELKTHLI